MSKTAYDLSRIEAVVFDIDGVLSPSTIPLGPDGMPQRMVNLKDGYAIQLAAKRGIKLAIISGASPRGIIERYQALGIKDIYLGISDKRNCLAEWMVQNNFGPESVAYVGDDIPDIPAMHIVGLPIAPADAAFEAKREADYVTVAQGGHGVAREILQQVLAAKDLWMADESVYSW